MTGSDHVSPTHRPIGTGEGIGLSVGVGLGIGLGVISRVAVAVGVGVGESVAIGPSWPPENTTRAMATTAITTTAIADTTIGETKRTGPSVATSRCVDVVMSVTSGHGASCGPKSVPTGLGVESVRPDSDLPPEVSSRPGRR